MSDDHKAALAVGREQGRAVRRYLEALDAQRPKRGRRRSEESMRKRLEAIESELAIADPLKRLHLAQERIDLTEALNATETAVDLDALQAEFVTAAGDYGRRKSITYTAWREVGVPSSVLEQAGISRPG
jgi:uncharacterized protein YicC (UPF0701 family)